MRRLFDYLTSARRTVTSVLAQTQPAKPEEA